MESSRELTLRQTRVTRYSQRGSALVAVAAFLAMDAAIALSSAVLTATFAAATATSAAASWLLRGRTKQKVRQIEHTLLTEHTERIRQWEFPLWPDWSLSGKDLVRAKEGIAVKVFFGSDEVNLARPLSAEVKLFEARTEGSQGILFPEAKAGVDGNVIDYGPVAVLLGTSYGLPFWDLSRDTETYRWQLPGVSI